MNGDNNGKYSNLKKKNAIIFVINIFIIISFNNSAPIHYGTIHGQCFFFALYYRASNRPAWM